jgi:hypothetical protein
MDQGGGRLLEAVAERVLARYLRRAGATGVMVVDQKTDPARMSGVDLVYTRAGSSTRVKVKADPYFGTDPHKIADQGLLFYRGIADSYAFEIISHHVTRDPGWIYSSTADELFYYFVALSQTEEDVAALMGEADEVFFSELAVERDELHIIPMAPLKAWFETHHERYMPRPVRFGDHSGWYRIIPAGDIASAVPSIQVKGPVFAGLDQP